MTAGFDYDEHNSSYYSPYNSYYKMVQSGDMLQYMLDLKMVFEPGTKWVYCTGCSNLLGAIIEQVSGLTLEEFAENYLFDLIGIKEAYWERMTNGISTGTGLSMSIRNMGRLAYLYLNHGIWDKREILPLNWSQEIATPKVENVEYSEFSQTGYSYQWWTFYDKGIYFAWGSDGDQMLTRIMVIPHENLIAVITGYGSPDPSEYIIARFILPSLNPSSDGNFIGYQYFGLYFPFLILVSLYTG
jgi:CubicO group peptidase (beta-lactamase class C family)